MQRNKVTVGLCIISIMGWVALWVASFSGQITSELSQEPWRWVMVGVVWWMCVLLARTEKVTAAWARLTQHIKGWHIAGAMSLIVLGVTSYIALETYGATPRAQDEVNYFFMGKMFASGHLWLDALPANDFVNYRFFVTGERIYSLFQPGWPVLLALGHLIEAPWLMGPLCAAVATFLLYLVGRELLDEKHALFATIMMSFGQAWWMQGASMMSHMFACVLGLAGVYFALCVRDQARSHVLRHAMLAGLFFGAMFTVRSGTAVALSLPVILGGVYLIVRRRVSWRIGVCFGVGLALTGALQLLYNWLMSGNPLVFAQDAYFNLTEPIERCHRLGIGEGVGCPYEHGPDLGRDGFTWGRAWEVTTIRIAQLRWDMFGTGVALWTGIFALVSREFWRQKLFLFGLIASVMGLYFFYYYHGNLYGARYYFEVLPYVMLWLVCAWMSLVSVVKDAFVERTIVRRILIAFVLGSVLVMPTHHLLVGFEKKHDYYSKAWSFMKAVERAEQSSELVDAVIIMPNASRSYWTGFAQNRGDLAGERIYVRDWGSAMNARLTSYYPERQFYRPRFVDGEVTFVPTTLRSSERFVIEGEAMFPVPKRARGYAVTQSLKGWPKAKASRREHLLFEKTQPGSWLEFRVFVTRAGSYRLEGRLTAGPDYGTIRLVVNEQVLAPHFDGYDRDVLVKSWQGEQVLDLKEGWNTITLEVMGKAAKSRGYVAGIDQLTFIPLD